MISEGSCHSKDRNNDENSVLPSEINCILKYKRNCNISQNCYCFYTIFYQINAALVSISD